MYAELCEAKLFTAQRWIVRYHGIGESAEAGLSIARRSDGRFTVTLKEAEPQLGATLFFAMDNQLDVKAALKTVKIKEAHAEIPESVATAVRDFWISLLRDVQPYKQSAWTSISTHVALFAKSADGRTLSGRLPPDAFKYRRLNAVEDIVDKLMRVCRDRQKSDKALFEEIERAAKTYNHAPQASSDR